MIGMSVIGWPGPGAAAHTYSTSPLTAVRQMGTQSANAFNLTSNPTALGGASLSEALSGGTWIGTYLGAAGVLATGRITMRQEFGGDSLSVDATFSGLTGSA